MRINIDYTHTDKGRPVIPDRGSLLTQTITFINDLNKEEFNGANHALHAISNSLSDMYFDLNNEKALQQVNDQFASDLGKFFE